MALTGMRASLQIRYFTLVRQHIEGSSAVSDSSPRYNANVRSLRGELVLCRSSTAASGQTIRSLKMTGQRSGSEYDDFEESR